MLSCHDGMHDSTIGHSIQHGESLTKLANHEYASDSMALSGDAGSGLVAMMTMEATMQAMSGFSSKTRIPY